MVDTTEKTQWLYRTKVTPPYWHTTGPTEQDDEVLSDHVDYLKGLVETGVIILAGPTLNEDDTRFGIVVFTAPTEEDAREIMNNDPAVKTGLMHGDLFPFWVAMRGK